MGTLIVWTVGSIVLIGVASEPISEPSQRSSRGRLKKRDGATRRTRCQVSRLSGFVCKHAEQQERFLSIFLECSLPGGVARPAVGRAVCEENVVFARVDFGKRRSWTTFYYFFFFLLPFTLPIRYQPTCANSLIINTSEELVIAPFPPANVCATMFFCASSCYRNAHSWSARQACAYSVDLMA